MPIALVAVAAVGLGLSVYQTVDAKKKEKEAKKAAEEYDRQQLKNPYENLQVSTLGADLQQQNLNNQVGTAVDTLRAGGTRAILGGLPTIYDSVIQSNNQIAAGLDQQYVQNQNQRAQGALIVQNMNEQRERDDLLGIGNAINTYQQQYNQGLTETIKGLSNVASAGSTLNSGGSASGAKSSNTSNSNTSQFGMNYQDNNGLNFNTSTIQPSSQPTNGIQANLYGNQLDQYNSYLYGTKRRF